MNQIKNDHVELGLVYFVFIFRLAFTQLHCVSRKGFLIHGNTAAQPSHFPWLVTSGYLSLPFLLLTVVNFLFSWNGQKLDTWESGLGGNCPCRDSFNGKNPHLPEQGWQHIWHKYIIVSCIRHINALYLWFWENVERWDKTFLWRVRCFFFTCMVYHAMTPDTERSDDLSAGCVQRLMLTQSQCVLGRFSR